MFDIGWSEMAVIALIALVVIGPKDLPNTMKTIAHWMRKARSLTREFQSGIDDMVREAELEDAKKALDATRRGNLESTISNALDPDDEVGSEVRAVEREARRETDAADSKAADSKAADSKAEHSATERPAVSANIAPPHSLTPPGETSAGPASGDDKVAASGASGGSKQTA